MEVIDIEIELELHGDIMNPKDGRKSRYAPHCDVEVTSKENENC